MKLLDKHTNFHVIVKPQYKHMYNIHFLYMVYTQTPNIVEVLYNNDYFIHSYVK